MTSSRTALVVVDLQADYFQDDELAGRRDELVSAVNRLVAAARSAGVPVVEVRTEHAADRSTWTLSMLEDDQGITLEGTPGAEPVAGLDTGGAEQVVKTRDSAFFGTDLAARLDALDVGTVVLCGVSTEACIAATATDAFAHDLRVEIVSDATASTDPDRHDDALAQLQGQYRQDVVTTDEVCRRWSA